LIEIPSLALRQTFSLYLRAYKFIAILKKRRERRKKLEFYKPFHFKEKKTVCKTFPPNNISLKVSKMAVHLATVALLATRDLNFFFLIYLIKPNPLLVLFAKVVLFTTYNFA